MCSCQRYMLSKPALLQLAPRLGRCGESYAAHPNKQYIWHSDVVISKCVHQIVGLGCWDAETETDVAYKHKKYFFQEYAKAKPTTNAAAPPSVFAISFHPLKTMARMVNHHLQVHLYSARVKTRDGHRVRVSRTATGQWKQHRDAKTGRVYYASPTGKTQWDAPHHLVQRPNGSPNADTKHTAASRYQRPLRVAVCIVGQLQRLETASKQRALVEELAADTTSGGFEVSYFGVLQAGAPVFANTAAASNVHCWKDDAAARMAFHQTFGSDASLSIPGVRDFRKEVNALEGRAALKKYRALLQRKADNKAARAGTTGASWRSRAELHLNQLTNVADCARMVIQAEKAESGGERKPFDVVVKIRDGGAVVAGGGEALRHQLRLALRKNAVLTKRCNRWGGVNDKFAIIPRGMLVGAMQKPLFDFKHGSSFLAGILNPEMLLRESWHAHGVESITMTARALPIVDSRCVTLGSANTPPRTALVPVWKDCRVETAMHDWGDWRNGQTPIYQ